MMKTDITIIIKIITIISKISLTITHTVTLFCPCNVFDVIVSP